MVSQKVTKTIPIDRVVASRVGYSDGARKRVEKELMQITDRPEIEWMQESDYECLLGFQDDLECVCEGFLVDRGCWL